MRYAKNDVYAEVEEEAGKINRLVATAGQPVPAAYDHLVEDKQTTTDPDDAKAAELARGTSARRKAERPEEPSHEEFVETAAGPVGPADGGDAYADDGSLASSKPPAKRASRAKSGSKTSK